MASEARRGVTSTSRLSPVMADWSVQSSPEIIKRVTDLFTEEQKDNTEAKKN